MRVMIEGLAVDACVAAFLNDQALPGSGVDPLAFWIGLSQAIRDLAPENRRLLDRRAALQAAIDRWHVERRGAPHDAPAYRRHLEDIGYLAPDPAPFTITTTGTDPEIALLAGPQLVVPVTRARYALNAANARWGSLYDALYGTDALGTPPPAGPFDPARGARVVAWAKRFLDDVVPLALGPHAAVPAYRVEAGALVPALRDPGQFAGYRGEPGAPTAVLLRNNGLHMALHIDRARTGDPAGVADIHLEAALSVIMDLEDSVACVDGADKAAAWAVWLGLMRGDLTETVTKSGFTTERRLAADLAFTAPGGAPLILKGRALMLVRNTGHLMTTPAMLMDGHEVPEGILDAFVTVLCALHDKTNSAHGAVYIVKPKMHGPEEVAFADRLFARVEDVLNLPPGTVKMGIMDEERRTSANLAACIHAARTRVCFINTGFLDRTGDEIHTGMEAGPMLPKGAMKDAAWLSAYEARNVATGLACGFAGRAQIGKGMWAAPDRMAAMLAEKIAHPQAGASCAWVPSPTAAVLHATHYHRVDVAARQAALAAAPEPRLDPGLDPGRDPGLDPGRDPGLDPGRDPGRDPGLDPGLEIDALLTLPLAGDLPADLVAHELANNAQGILGYVVRWIDQGVGCSKVLDIHDVALMEDRATCRISAQALANWLHHGVVTEDQVMDAMQTMAAVVDRQNAGDPAYQPMAPAFDGTAFRAACDLVLLGRSQPSGYTEPLLHAHRRAVKDRA